MKKGKIFVVILVLLALIGAGVYIFLATDLFKTPEQLFQKYLIKNVIEISKFNNEPYGDILKQMNSGKSEINLDIPLDTSDLMLGDVETAKMSFNVKTDSESKSDSVSLTLFLDELENSKIALARTDNILGLAVKGLHEKYLGIENKDLKKFAENLGAEEEFIEQIPNEIPLDIKTTEDTEQSQKVLIKFFKNLLGKLNSKEKYTAEKDVQTEVNAEMLVANKYTFTTTTQEFFKAYVSTTKELLDDPEFLVLIEDEQSKTVLDELKTKLTDFEESINEIDDVELKFAVYSSKGKTVKNEIEIDEGIVDLCFVNKETESTAILTIKSKEEEAVSNIILNNSYQNNAGVFTLETKSEVDGETESSKIILTAQKSDNRVDTEIQLENNGELSDAVATLSLKSGAEVMVEQLTNENTLILNNYTSEDFEDLFTEIEENIDEAISDEENSNTFLNILSMFMMFSGTSNNNDYEMDYSTDYDSSLYDDYYTDDYATTDDYTDSDVEDDFSSNWNEEEDLSSSLIIDSENSSEYIEEKNEIDRYITDGIEYCLREYKIALLTDTQANLGDYLTIENIQNYALGYDLMLIDGTTIKCTDQSNGDIFYATMDINGETLTVTEVEVFTEDEFLE